jgi:hypothetical protein
MACSKVPVNGAQMEHRPRNLDGAKWSTPDPDIAPPHQENAERGKVVKT